MNNSVVAKAERNYIFRGHLYSVMQSKDTEVLVRFWVLGYKKLKKKLRYSRRTLYEPFSILLHFL